MANTSHQRYRDMASLLWLLGALLLGVSVAMALGADKRQTLFAVVLAVGVVVLFRLNGRPREGATVSHRSNSTKPDLVQQLLHGDTLSSEAARTWLDQLLVAQQEEEQK